jgi:hypothetical protein
MRAPGWPRCPAGSFVVATTVETDGEISVDWVFERGPMTDARVAAVIERELPRVDAALWAEGR